MPVIYYDNGPQQNRKLINSRAYLRRARWRPLPFTGGVRCPFLGAAPGPMGQKEEEEGGKSEVTGGQSGLGFLRKNGSAVRIAVAMHFSSRSWPRAL